MSAPATLSRTTFKTSRLLDFAAEKELVAQIGHQRRVAGRHRARASGQRIDAAEEAGTPPVITVTVDRGGITVEDNGPGIPADVVEDILDFSVRVSSREAYVSPTRGAQGNALKTIVAMPFVLDGDAAGSRSRRRARGTSSTSPSIASVRSRPSITASSPARSRIGTRIKVDWPDSACSILADAKAQFLQIADQYAWLNPHLTITVDWFGERSTERGDRSGMGEVEAVGSDLAALVHRSASERLVAGYIAHDADRGRSAPCASWSPSSAACTARQSKRRSSIRRAWHARR